MFPWTDGFHWTITHVVFLSLFFSVLLTIAATLACAVRMTTGDLRQKSAVELCWKSDFSELPDSERRCRHELSGRVVSRQCDNAFDCRSCRRYSEFAHLPAAGTVHELGINYDAQRFYHRGHTWLEPQPDGTFSIGLDDLAERLIGDPSSVVMPVLGAEIELNGTAWRMKKNGMDVQVRAPIEGQVVDIGSPHDGWYLKIRPRLDPRDPRTLLHLLRGPEVPGWLSRELERLQLQLRSAETAPSLADGGVLIHGLMDAVPNADWDSVLAATFLEG